jgi:hypothetical protein
MFSGFGIARNFSSQDCDCAVVVAVATVSAIAQIAFFIAEDSIRYCLVAATMLPSSGFLEDRVTLLENRLKGLPERMGAVEVRLGSLEEQFVQFRGEVRAECSATRVHGIAMLKLAKAIERSMNQTRMLHEEAMSRIKLLDRG